MTEAKHPLKVFLCHAHIIPLWDAHSDKDAVKVLYTCLTDDGVERFAWLDKEKPCGERSRTILPGQDWELVKLALCD